MKTEILLYQGYLTADLRFEPIGLRTVSMPPPEENGTPSKRYLLEAHDAAGMVLNREGAIIDHETCKCHGGCGMNNPIFSKVSARLALPKGSKKIVFKKDEIVIVEHELGPSPKFKIGWKNRKITSRRKYTVDLDVPPLGEHDYIHGFYEYDGKIMPMGLCNKLPIKVNFAHLPGGKKCKIHLSLTVGLRSAVQSTLYFSAPEMKKKIHITSPVDKQTYTPWQPIELEGMVDGMFGARVNYDEEFIWQVNGKDAATGRIACLESLPAGKHKITAYYQKKSVASASIMVQINRPRKLKGIPARDWNKAVAGA